MRRVFKGIGTVLLTIVKWILKGIVGVLRLFLWLLKLVLLVFCVFARLFLALFRAGTI